MTAYGVISTGFSRKPLSVELAEIEAANVTELGPGVIQTSQSPLGQLNGIFADRVSLAWELAEDVYQSLDPDQAEGVRLDILGSVRRISRAYNESDTSYRQSITNEGQARIDFQDISRAIAALDGVTYSKVWDNSTASEVPPSFLCVAVTGGDDGEIAAALRKYVAPGITLFGSTVIESVIEGYCRSFRILRPIEVPVTLTVNVRTFRDNLGCPPPSAEAIKTAILNSLYLINGENISFYNIRQLVESEFSNVEVVSINGERDGITQGDNQDVDIGFIERATLSSDNLTVTAV